MASLYGIEYRVLFVFPRLTRILSPLHVIVYSPHPIPRLPHSYRRLPETKKKARQKNFGIAMLRCNLCQSCPHRTSLLCVTRPGGAIFSTTTSFDRAYKLLHAMASRRVNNRNLRVIPISQALFFSYSLFRSISPCPTTPPPPPPTITPLRLRVTATDKEASAYATLVGASNSPRSNRSVSVVVAYVTHLPFCPL